MTKWVWVCFSTRVIKVSAWVCDDASIAHKDFTITPNVNYKCPGSVAAIALPVAAIALPQPPIYLRLTWKKLASQMA